jgi:hypothetical protein
MPTMATFHASRVALITLLALLAAFATACSREQQDWRSAEGADTTEGWTRFTEQHPNSELVPEAKARIAEIAEARDWQHASRVATVAGYREFLAQHPSGRRSEDARIRIEAFSLGSAPRIDLPSPSEADSRGPSGVPALQIATGAASAPATAATDGTAASGTAPSGSSDTRVLAAPGEAAQAAPAALEAPSAVYAAVVSSEVPASTAPAMAVAAAHAVASPDGPAGYGVQLGAFGSEASADREWQRLQGRFNAQLGGLSPRIVLTSTNVGQLYRLQVAAAGEAQARAICDSLREQSQACMPVLPQMR